MKNPLHRRPLYISPWCIRIKPRMKVSFDTIWHIADHGRDGSGKVITQIIDEFDREYWLRLRPLAFRYIAWRTR